MNFYSNLGNVHNFPNNYIKNRTLLETKIISCLAKDITLFQELPDTLSSDDFYSDENKSFFSVYKILYNKNYKTIDSSSINTEFPYNTQLRDEFESYGGVKLTERIKHDNSISVINFDKYREDFLGNNAILGMYKQIVNTKEELEKGVLNTDNPEELYGFIDYRLSSSLSGYSVKNDTFQLGIDENFLQKCYSGEAVGIDYGFHEFNKKTLGLHLGNFSMFSASTNVGKTTALFSEYLMNIAKQKQKIFVYSNETDKADFQTNLLIYTLVHEYNYYKLTKNKLKTGAVTPEDKNMITKAQIYINKEIMPYVTIKRPESHNMKDFITAMRRYAYRGYNYFWIDTMKSDSAGDAFSVGKLVDQSRAIYETCKKLNVHCMASYQVATYHKDNMTRVLSEAHLAGSKQVSEVADIIMVARDIYYDEYNGEKKDILPFKFHKDENIDKWLRTPIELDRDKRYILIFLPKNRYGENGFCMVYEKLGQYGLFKEVGYCTPKD